MLAAGLLSTLQDGGRSGHRHLGVGASGALDAWSHALANRLARNQNDATTLEVTLAGPLLRFDRGVRIALCGARIDAHVDAQAIPLDRPVDLPAGSVLRLGGCRSGARAYLAVEGGFSAPVLLGSTSTDLRGGFGGMRGRAIAAGDVLPLAARSARRVQALRIAAWWVDGRCDDAPDRADTVRVLAGAHATRPFDALCLRPWRVEAASDRQGLRLAGDPLHAADARERISEPVFPGTVQLPPDGQPIVLLADAQTHGGYPRIGHVIRADWPRLAQRRPGDPLAFAACTPAQARQAWRAQCQRLARLQLAIAARQQDA